MNKRPEVNIKLKKNIFTLYAERAVYWHEQNALLIADLHLGKTASFRLHGLALPGGITNTDLKRIATLIKKTNAETLYVLGDFLHNKEGRAEKTLYVFEQWRKKHKKLKIILIRGNHDKRSGDPPGEFNIECFDNSFPVDNFILNHHPFIDKEKYVFSGHIHPAVRLKGLGRQREKLSCFLFKKNYAVLPSFGSFTGNHIIEPEAGDKIYVIAEDKVIKIKNT